MSLAGVFGRPFIDLEPWLDGDALARLDDEICRALTEVELGYTGGSHRSMGIVPPSRLAVERRYADYGEVIAGLDARQFEELIALADHPDEFEINRRSEYEFGEERDHPLNRKQMLFLKFKYGVYFPWKVFYELVPNERWEDKSRAAGKAFTREARRHFPDTVAFVERLPLSAIGRCTLLGLEANDHGTVHRDGDQREKPEVDHFIVLCPRKNKRLFLWDEPAGRPTLIESRAYWFNDSDYHGVAADPFFRYSIRVDGVFQPSFLRALTA